MTIAIGVLMVILAGLIVVRQRRALRDEMFAGPTPGLLPAPGQSVERVRVSGRDAPPVAVRFDPPDGVRPGLAGVIIDSRPDPVEIAATLVDLGIRGWLTMRPLEADQATAPRGATRDWELQQLDPPAGERLTHAEQAILARLFADGRVTTLSTFRARGTAIGSALAAFEGEARERHWFAAPVPSRVLLGVLGLVAGGFLLVFSSGLLPLAVGLIVAGLVVVIGGRAERRPVSAEGYAARVQAQGFKQYLATAEAEQLRFEVGIEQFSRYLPYAMVFGVVDHWRHVFADAVQLELAAGHEDFTGFAWLGVGDTLTTLAMVDLVTDGGLLDGFVQDFGGGDSGGWFDSDGGPGDSGWGGDGGSGDAGGGWSDGWTGDGGWGGMDGGFGGGDFGGGGGE